MVREADQNWVIRTLSFGNTSIACNRFLQVLDIINVVGGFPCREYRLEVVV